MKMKQAVQRPGERGIVLFLGILSLAAIIPMVGISVDVGYLYASKARLQASVDGAALAAARSLNLGSSTSAQALSAQQNAVNWFYSNFPPGNWQTTNTTMNLASVQVYDDVTNPNLRHVDVTASTRVPTYFMKWFRFNNTTINAKGFASRRDAVVMLVLDRSGSMSGTACTDMKNAAKIFTGQFAAGRDYIGMVSFSDGSNLYSTPVQNFRTVLGYTDGSTSGAGGIDSIACTGGTGSPEAISVGYNALYQRYLPGAFNVLVFESDGLPNTMVMNMWDGSAYAFASNGTSGSPLGCKDANGKAKVQGGWNNAAAAKAWTTGMAMNTITTNTPHAGFIANIPTGTIGGIYSVDPTTSTKTFTLMANYVDASGNSGLDQLSTTTPSCLWNMSGSSSTSAQFNDFAWLPASDVFGNSVKPALNPYKPGVVLTGTSPNHLRFPSSDSVNTKWQNYHDAALNATDNAAYRARTNANIPASVFVIGLGSSVDHTLLQRLANDERGDASVPYTACSANPSCVHYDTQPQGTYIYSSNSAVLKAKFLELSSQILRLSQ
jgi:Flp pilus assembly protein TadG